MVCAALVVAADAFGVGIPHAKRISAAGHEVSGYSLAGNADGDFAAVWQTYAPRGHVRIFERDRLAGGSWSPRQDFTRLRADAGGAAVAVAPNGAVTVGWSEQARDGSLRLMGAFRKPGAHSFGRERRIAAHSRAPGDLDLAVAADGTVMAAWVEQFDRRVLTSVRKSNGGWTRPEVVTKGNRFPARPQLAFDSAGNATLVWELPEPPDEILARHAGHNPEPEVRVAVRPVGGQFGRPKVVSRPGSDAEGPFFVENANGDAIVMWTDGGPRHSHYAFARYGPNRIGYAFRRGGGGFGKPRWLTRKSENASRPQATIDPSGNVLAFWDRPVPKQEARMVVARRPEGGDFGPARVVSPKGVTADYVAGNGKGDALAVWELEKGRSGYIEGRFVAAGGGFGYRWRFSRLGALNFDPAALLADDGRALVAWTRVAHAYTTRATDVLEVARVRVGK